MARGRFQDAQAKRGRWHEPDRYIPVTAKERVVCHGVTTLLVEFSDGAEVSVSDDGETILIEFGDERHELPRGAAADLQEAIGDALTRRREFFRTAGQHRADGGYVVERRGADSAGNAKVFDSFNAVTRLYDRLPREFTAEDVGRAGITGSRRHMLIRHFAEHPAFDCTIEQRNPLVGRKTRPSDREHPAVTADESGGEVAPVD